MIKVDQKKKRYNIHNDLNIIFMTNLSHFLLKILLTNYRKKIKAVSFDLFPFLLKIKPSTQVTNSMPFIVFRKDHLRSTLGIIYCWGSLAVQFGDHLFGLGIICSRGSFAALFNTQHISKIFLASTALSQRVFSSDFLDLVQPGIIKYLSDLFNSWCHIISGRR